MDLTWTLIRPYEALTMRRYGSAHIRAKPTQVARLPYVGGYLRSSSSVL